MPFEEKPPEWNAPGIEPPASKKNTGWTPGEKPPAEYWNWQMNRTYKVLQELQQKAAEKVEVQQAQQTANEAKTAADAAQSDISAHISATTGVHGATSTAAPNTLVQRDPNGRFKAAAPSASDDVARKAEVDAVTTQKVNVISEMDASAPGSNYPIGITAFQVFDGIQKGWPSPNGVVTTVYLASHRCMQFYMVSANNNTSNGRVYVRSWRQDSGWTDFRRVWDSQEMGAGSGLDADLLDGLHASSFWTKSEIPYETGTWTPELRFELDNSGVTHSNRGGRYVRIGNIVYFSFRVALSSKGSANGDAYIAGLPFTAASGGANHAVFAIGLFNRFTLPSNAYWIYGIVLNGTNFIRIRPAGDLDPDISLSAAYFKDNTDIRGEGFYFIS